MNYPGLITRSPSPGAGAVFSPCEKYRYLLWRGDDAMFARKGFALWLLYNPSTANELVLDPTLRRVDGFTRGFGYGWWEVANAYAWRSTDPKGLLKTDDPVGPANDMVIADRIAKADAVIVGWGALPVSAERTKRLFELAAGKPLHCLGTTKDGHPRHPLYLPSSAELQPWAPS